MKIELFKYWFESGQGRGIGVTAYSVDDAVSLIQNNDLVMSFEPDFNNFVKDIDIQKLDENHVIPNMGICTNRGIWFPNINS